MRRRSVLLGLMIFVATLLFSSTQLLLQTYAEPGREKPGWRVALDNYLAYQARKPASWLRYVAARRADLPWEFTPGMQETTYGDGIHFATTHNWSTNSGNQIPLPYPPTDVWCVTLEEEPMTSATAAPATAAGASRQRVVFIAYHEELYTASWVVHNPQASPTSPQVAATLAAIGCD